MRGNGRIASRGLSPRVRGNRRAEPYGHNIVRSIPACAGEPTGVTSSSTMASVYPRVCGGTPRLAAATSPLTGLSPRVRGNPGLRRTRRQQARSIPACAGEPLFDALQVIQLSVYPRVCGGTPRVVNHPQTAVGLSPRVRGNPNQTGWGVRAAGSIPACAGEPKFAHLLDLAVRVYPRVCGGTYTTTARPTARWGLSPRVRGNHGGVGVHRRLAGSIPACAGEPRLPLL